MNGLQRLVVRGVDLVNRRGKSVGVRLVKLTGKRPYAIHPKHLVDQPWHDWYLPVSRPPRLRAGRGLQQRRPPHARGDRVPLDRRLRLRSAPARDRGPDCPSSALPGPGCLPGTSRGPFPFPDRTFEKALFLDVIEHLVPRVAVLRRDPRVLKDDGRLLVSGPNRENSWRRTLRAAGLFAYSDPDHKIEYTRERVPGRAARGRLRAGRRGDAGGARHTVGRRHRRGGRRLAPALRPAQPLEAGGGAPPAEESTGFRVVARKRA